MNVANDSDSPEKAQLATAPARALIWSTFLCSGSFAATLMANPTGLVVTSGTVNTTANGPRLTLDVSQHAILDWRSFNIAPGETTTFLQPSAQSVVVNRIRDQNPSQIWGSLIANGTVILANQSGFYFGPNSMISVGGSFIATTASLPADFGYSGLWSFAGMPPLADIVNYGTVETRGGGSVYLIAERVVNHGELAASGGDIWLAAGKEVLVSERPDGRGMSAKVTVPTGAVDNFGRITASAGTIGLHAKVVNQGGALQADSVRERNGVIELLASSELNLGRDSTISARGDDSGSSPGGKITLKSEGSFHDTATSRVDTSGGSRGGNGGEIEVSAQNFHSLASQINAPAQAGSAGGHLLIDPRDIELSTSGTGQIGSNGTVGPSDSGILRLDVNNAFRNGGFSDIVLQASRDITLKQGTVWNLSESTGLTSGAHQLTLQAGRDILFENNARITDANHWSVQLDAGYNFTAKQVEPRAGTIFLNGGTGKSLTGAIETAQGNIKATAGKDILVGTGFVRTVNGGNIHINALAGDVDAGKRNDNYEFITTGYRVSIAGPGGITTTKGGDVILDAGNDIRSVPTLSVTQPNPGGSGALGSEHGDVTLNAGRFISGNFFLRNGTGTLLAGVKLGKDPTTHKDIVQDITNPLADIGSEKTPVSLSLVSGTWNAWAANDTFISEIRNPNGTFNRNRLGVPDDAYPGNAIGGLGNSATTVLAPERSTFLFDYTPNAGANLWSGHGITLLGANLPRVKGQNDKMPAVYPPQLSLEAGSGGIDVRNSLVLFPSSIGGLGILTHNGGNLFGPEPKRDETAGTVVPSVILTVSDSGLPDFNSFADGHAVVPRHLNDPNPVKVDVSGSIRNFSLNLSTRAEITVHKGTYNFGLNAQNLSQTTTTTNPDGTASTATTATTLTVGEDIVFRGNLTETDLAQPLPAAFFNPLLISNPQLIQRISYSAATGKLGFSGQMSNSDRDYLQNPEVRLLDPVNGAPIINPETGLQKTAPLVLSEAQKAAFRDLYERSGDASLGDQGLSLAGPGKFIINARNIDLGISSGIRVRQPTRPLEAISPFGAALEVRLRGNLDMTTTRIANESLLGTVLVDAKGSVNVGGPAGGLAESSQIKGIFSTSGGGVTVLANGNINVNGSRIATYNGGDINVKSITGDVNAGSGGSGFVTVNSLELDPSTGKLRTIFDTVPGSGILTAALKGGNATLGSINVATETGSINASLGGFIQFDLNNNPANAFATISLDSKKNIDASGSGIIGRQIKLKAGGDIRGLIVGRGAVDIAGQNVAVNAVSTSTVNINASGTVSGTVVGGGSVSVTGDSISAALVSKSVNATGDTSSAAVGVPTSNAPKADTKVADDGATTASKNSSTSAEDEEQKKKQLASTAKLTRYVGRVTVILPGKTAN